jgi:hypothetical protein
MWDTEEDANIDGCCEIHPWKTDIFLLTLSEYDTKHIY